MGRSRLSVRDRIIAQTSVNPETGCWEWLCGATADGYGRMRVTKAHKVHEVMFTHRAAYEEWVGPIPEGLVIDHLCRNPTCCNPAHLEPVTQTENVLRGESPSNAFRVTTHCIWGHAFTPENTYLDKRGRYCRACRKRRNAESLARKKARA